MEQKEDSVNFAEWILCFYFLCLKAGTDTQGNTEWKHNSPNTAAQFSTGNVLLGRKCNKPAKMLTFK